jgi:hypothetical protein
MLYTTVAMAIRYFGGAYVVPGGSFAASALTAPVFGNAGAKAAMSAKSLILTCMLSNAYIVSLNMRRHDDYHLHCCFVHYLTIFFLMMHEILF